MGGIAVRWSTNAIPDTWEVEVRRLQSEAGSRQKHKTLSKK
jgi:hypothetical protein